MSFEKENGGFTFVCDMCDVTAYVKKAEFVEAWNWLKDNDSWIAQRDDRTGTWQHFCPDCEDAAA